jgi:hypothetical protein
MGQNDGYKVLKSNEIVGWYEKTHHQKLKQLSKASGNTNSNMLQKRNTIFN